MYKGNFNQKGLFTGKSYLSNDKGEYNGDFVDGKKHGKG